MITYSSTEPGDYAMCCKSPDYEQWLESIIKEIEKLGKMGCCKIVKLTSCPLALYLSIAVGSTNYNIEMYTKQEIPFLLLPLSSHTPPLLPLPFLSSFFRPHCVPLLSSDQFVRGVGSGGEGWGLGGGERV